MPKIKTKGYLSKFSQVNETRVRIAFCLYQSETPLKTSEIASKTKLSPRLVRYHLPKLVAEGIAIRTSGYGYTLQPFFYDSEIMDSIYACMSPIVTLINQNYDVEEIEIAHEKGMLNCIQTILHFVNIEIEKLEN